MISLTEYLINEARSFTLTDSERGEVTILLGYLTGNLGEDSDIKKYAEYWTALSDEEQQQLNELYDVFNDENSWPKINNRIIKDDISLLVNFLNWVDENELWNDDTDGVNALEKIEQ